MPHQKRLKEVLGSLPVRPSLDELPKHDPSSGLTYLSSSRALESLKADPYWPKWDSPWWHISLLDEMGETTRVPSTILQSIVDAFRRQYVNGFFASEVPPGRDPVRDTFCHCSLGTIQRILSRSGVDLETLVPWIRNWLERYQLSDGGLNCDCKAYKAGAPASSMVGTVCLLEGRLANRGAIVSRDDPALRKGMGFLIERELRLGCSAPGNAEEKEDEESWTQLTFPRFYFYDILRGLELITLWSEETKQPIPASAILSATEMIARKDANGILKVERQAHLGVGTRCLNSAGQWVLSRTAQDFPLLRQVSEVGRPSRYLTTRWTETRARLKNLLDQDLLT